MEKQARKSYLVQVTLTEQTPAFILRVTNETVLNVSSIFSIDTQNLINHTNVTSVGNVQYLEGGKGRCKSEEGDQL